MTTWWITCSGRVVAGDSEPIGSDGVEAFATDVIDQLSLLEEQQPAVTDVDAGATLSAGIVEFSMCVTDADPGGACRRAVGLVREAIDAAGRSGAWTLDAVHLVSSEAPSLLRASGH